MAYIDNYGNLVTYEDSYSLELYHHGILGMKHGKRNGPPYPLSRGAHSAAERRAGWTKSLASVAKATGKGVARGVVGTAKGVRAVARGTKKALIRVNLYPKKLMSAQDIADKVERLRQEDELKRAMGKLTAEDKLNQKIKQKDAMREVVKQTLSQLLPAIGKDVIIRQIQKNQDMKYEIQKKEEMADIDMANEQSKKVWQDIYDDARAAGKSAAEAMKLANKGEGKDVNKLTPKESKNSEAKERDKKVWNDLYEDARAAGKSASEARKIADSGKSDIAARPKDSNNGKGGKQGFDIDNATTKDIYETAKANGFTATEAAKMARDRDDSALKGLFGKSSNGNNEGNGGKKNRNKNDASSDESNGSYERYLNAALAKGAGQREAEYLARRRQETVTQAELDAAYAENKKVTANRKREATIERNAMVNGATEALIANRKGTYKEKSAQERLKTAIDSELDRTIDAIRENGGKDISVFNGTISYKNKEGKERFNHYADRAADDLERRMKEERKKG